MSRTLVLIGLTLMSTFGIGQVKDHGIRQLVVEKGGLDSTFVFGKWSEDGGTETHLKLLGEVNDTKGRRVKVITSSWIWGLGMRATNRILIFSGTNHFLGQYEATTIHDLPVRMERGCMVFENRPDEQCAARGAERVDLTRGLPKRFFLECKGEFVFY